MKEVAEIIKQFKEKNPKPVYLIHGDEAFYIDKITNAAAEFLLDESEKDFNQTILYGKDVNIDHLQQIAKQFPMMADRQLIIVKEAQEIKNWGIMENYFENPTPSTVLVIAHKHGKADSRKRFFKSIKRNGIIFESKQLYENQVDGWIINYLKEYNYTISPKANILLIEFLGTDLSKIAKELEKLMIVLKEGTQINESHIEENIGISKDYNVFELTNAIASIDIVKANRIIKYFEENPKAGNIVQIVYNLYAFHEKLMKAHFSNASDISALMKLGMSYPAAKEIMRARTIYTPKKVAKNIAILQEYDLKSKGINRGPGEDGDLMRELTFLLMH